MGYGSFPLDMIEFLWRAKQPYNVSVASEVAACAALTNMDYLNKVRMEGAWYGVWMLFEGQTLGCLW